MVDTVITFSQNPTYTLSKHVYVGNKTIAPPPNLDACIIESHFIFSVLFVLIRSD